MPEVFLIATPSGWAAFDADQLQRALTRGADLMPRTTPAINGMNTSMTTDTPALLSATQMEAATGIPRTWFERMARERRIPFRKLGRYTRFVLAEVTQAEAFQRCAIPAGGVIPRVTGLHDRSASKK